FADVYATSFAGVSSTTAGSGVRVVAINQQFTQGNINFTDNNLDLALNGEGFFVLNDNGDQSYTRSGSFKVDRDGNVVDHAGNRLQVFSPVNNGTSFNTGVLQDLTLSTADGAPHVTTSITAGLNLDSSQAQPALAFDSSVAETYNYSTSLTVYDSLGAPHTSTMFFAKTAVDNIWDTFMEIDGTPVTVGGAASATMQFDQSGALILPAGGNVVYDAFAPPGGAGPISMTIDYTNATQFGSKSGVNDLSQDGYASGRLSGVDIDSSGVVFARFTNGQSRALGQVALADFANPGGLSQLGNTAWSETFESGDVILGAAGTSNLGSIQAGALEASNVDIAEQLVGLITAQRNFQANSQVISTADTITQTIINIR
ncbi:MAG TPA: flagellar hook protein FlgE, partial [Chromatiaceae bacterium]|nr:flagellar hook protein FlgE [Chromatiaceae bacterium]